MDPAGAAEARLVASAPSFLRLMWSGRHWRLYRVRDPAPLAAGAAQVRLGTSDVRLRADRAGPILLRVHWTRYWGVTAGPGCVARRGAWTVLDAWRPGRFVLTARFSLARIVGAQPCGPNLGAHGR
jgi:hypothetical protein